MRDAFGRTIRYLRVSVTDRCNLRCTYCMPKEGVAFMPHDEILRLEEIERVVAAAAALGIDRVRLTGGEPLVRKGIVDLVAGIRAVEGIKTIGLTTNGVLLAPMAGDLLRAGVDLVNISLDTTDRARYEALSGFDRLDDALNGLEAALALPFRRVKLNAVLAPDSRPQDWLGVIELARDRDVDVRLIEWMPMAFEETPLGGSEDILARLEATYGTLTPLPLTNEGGPARLFSLPGFRGSVGLIDAMSNHFCDRCNRLRLTSTGDLKLCLFSDAGVALKPLLRGGASDEEIAEAIRQALRHKPKGHEGRVCGSDDDETPRIALRSGMYNTGG